MTKYSSPKTIDLVMFGLSATSGDCIYNPGHNILALFNNLAYVWITTSKTTLDIYHNKLRTWVASRVAERLKIPTALSPLGGPWCPHKKKKDLGT